MEINKYIQTRKDRNIQPKRKQKNKTQNYKQQSTEPKRTNGKMVSRMKNTERAKNQQQQQQHNGVHKCTIYSTALQS